jgi:hypothetical protein
VELVTQDHRDPKETQAHRVQLVEQVTLVLKVLKETQGQRGHRVVKFITLHPHQQVLISGTFGFILMTVFFLCMSTMATQINGLRWQVNKETLVRLGPLEKDPEAADFLGVYPTTD